MGWISCRILVERSAGLKPGRFRGLTPTNVVCGDGLLIRACQTEKPAGMASPAYLTGGHDDRESSKPPAETCSDFDHQDQDHSEAEVGGGPGCGFSRAGPCLLGTIAKQGRHGWRD